MCALGRNASWKKQVKNIDIEIFTEEDRVELNSHFNKIWPGVEQLAKNGKKLYESWCNKLRNIFRLALKQEMAG